MTTSDFCKWANKTMLPTITIQPGFSRRVSVSTCRTCLLELGLEVLTPRNKVFFDGHEKEDVKTQTSYLRSMVKLGFLHFTDAPTPKTVEAIPRHIKLPTAVKQSKTVYFFHDESTFYCNDDQGAQTLHPRMVARE